jgi:toluene monooxygenase system protein E
MPGGRKTYWHLGADHRLPSEYEITTSRLLYYLDRGGFAVQVPASGFYARHQRGSPLACDRWEAFADPRATTYARYVTEGRDRERFVGQLLATIEDSGYDRALPEAWVDTLAGVLSPLRFVLHGLQMLAAYVGQMAPAGRIAVAALFQAGDELRRLQRVAYRVAQLRGLRPDVDRQGRDRWQSEPAWQPLRRLVERLLVTYDWGEALVAVCLGAKPLVDELFLVELAARADRAGDYVDAQILRALHEDAAWHRAWAGALLRLALEDRPSNREVVERWLAAWAPALDDAAAGAGAALGEGGAGAAAEARERARAPARELGLGRGAQGG